MEKKTIGSFIAALRKAKGLTQRQLADMLNVSDKAVSRWERDETAPDLSLIPILADIFEVTSDEILRGQRSDPTEMGSKYEVRQTEKQVQYLLNRSKTDFQIRCVITALVALCGLVGAMICNAFHRANLGFYIALFFYIVAAACQSIFLIQASSNIQNDEISAGTSNFKKDLIFLSEAVFTLITALLAATLPLLTYIPDTYMGLFGQDWLLLGVAYGAASIGISLLIIYFINCRIGYAHLPDLKTPRNQLRVRILGTLCLILIFTFAIHIFVHEYFNANPQYLTEGTRWDSWEELKEYLETPLDPNGEEMEFLSTIESGITEYAGADGTIHYVYEDQKTVLVYEKDMKTPKYEYIRRNYYIQHFSYSATDDHFPIYTYTNTQMIIAENNLLYINLTLCALYIIEILITSILYVRKSKKI